MSAASQSPSRLTDALLDHVDGFSLATVPAGTIRAAKLVLLDTIGEMIAGSSLFHPTTRRLTEALATGTGQATVVGRGRSAAAADAAAVNAAFAAAGLRDPLHVATTMHAPAIVAGTLVSLASPGRTTGEDFLAAFVLGVEIACRTSDALDPAGVYERGFHPTAVCGTFGAAVGAARVLGLRAERMAAAIGLALQHAAGHAIWTRDESDSMRPLSPAIAARNGTTAAVLAAAGLGGSVAPFDGADSIFTAFSASPRPERVAADLGQRFFIAEMTCKLHASCTYTHAALDALFALRKEHAIAPDAVVSISAAVSPAALAPTTRPALRSCYMPHVLAIGLTAGSVAISHLVEPGRPDAAFDRLVAATEVVADPDGAEGAASVRLHLADGRVLSRSVSAARGTIANPLGEDDILAKYADAARQAARPSVADAIRRDVLDLDRLTDTSPLLTRLATLSA